MLESKIYFQKLWHLKIGWDETIPEKETAQWKNIEEKWANKILNFPRAVPTNGAISLQLHIFSDASPDAFSATAYLRAEFEGKIETNLIYSRARLRPKRMENGKDGLSIPRLELLGLLIATRIKTFLLAQLKRNINETYFWCDSQIVLGWLNSKTSLPFFVENRISEIRKTARNSFIKYVRSGENPADLATKPHKLEEIVKSIYGPKPPIG